MDRRSAWLAVSDCEFAEKTQNPISFSASLENKEKERKGKIFRKALTVDRSSIHLLVRQAARP